MQKAFLTLGLVLAAVFGLLWLTGGLLALDRWMIGAQREVQDTLAGAVRQIKTHQAGALVAFLGVCFGYGVLHAAGPGHGKVLIGGYGMGRRVPFWPLTGISLAASLAQSAVAVGFVYAGVALLGATRAAAQDWADRVMAPLGTLAIAGIGLWLMARGLRSLWRQRSQMQAAAHCDHHHDHDHHHHHDDDCGCGHAHGPSLAEVEQLTGWRDAALLVAGVAMRPCTGALFLLILTWQVGIGAAGVAGAFAMGLGTAVVTVGVAAMAVWAREGALASLPGAGIAKALPWFEVISGGVVALAALSLLSHNL